MGGTRKDLQKPKRPDLVRQCPNPQNNPKCKGELHYVHEGTLERAISRNDVCSSCAQFGHRDSAETRKKKSIARLGERNPFYGKQHSQEFLKAHAQRMKLRMLGEKNSFYGKRHTAESNEKNRQAQLGKKATEETKRKMSIAHKGFVWTAEALAKRKATRATPEFRALLSQRASGPNNPMFGKPSPTVRSIGGWFDGVHFRSSCELRFLISHPEISWNSAESLAYRIPYVTVEGKLRTYFPDFYGNGFLVEVKPVGDPMKGIYGRNTQQKNRAASQFCLARGWQFMVAEMPVISNKEVFQLRRNNQVELDRKWERKYQEWLKKAG